MLKVGAGVAEEVAAPLRGGGRATARDGKDRPGGMKGGREVAGVVAAGCRGGTTVGVEAGSGAELDWGRVSGHRDDLHASKACNREKLSALTRATVDTRRGLKLS